MLGLPKATEMSKQLPKKAIYAKFQMNTAAKEKIDGRTYRKNIRTSCLFMFITSVRPPVHETAG